MESSFSKKGLVAKLLRRSWSRGWLSWCRGRSRGPAWSGSTTRSGCTRNRRSRRQTSLKRFPLVDAPRRANACRITAEHMRTKRKDHQANSEAPCQTFQQITSALHAHQVGRATRTKLARQTAAFWVLR